MQLTWHGQYTIKITTKELVVVLDPHAPSSGLPAFRAKADIVGLTNPADPSMSHIDGVTGASVVVNSPGEYSFHGLSLHGFGWHDEAGQERSIMRWTIEGMTVLHLGALGRPLTESELAAINQTDIDVLLLPVGGGSGLSTKAALQLVSTIEPRCVVPIHYKIPNVKETLEPVDQFAKEMGVSASSFEKKIVLKANRLPHEDMQTMLIRP